MFVEILLKSTRGSGEDDSLVSALIEALCCLIVPGRLLVFCGVPGSGKTTIAHIVALKHRRSAHIQTDVVRGMIVRPTYEKGESEFVYDVAVAAAKEALDRGYLVLLDGTMATDRRRQKTVSALLGHCSKVDFVHIVCDLETALERNLARGAVVPPGRVRGIFADFEAPRGALTVDTSSVSAEEAAEEIEENLF